MGALRLFERSLFKKNREYFFLLLALANIAIVFIVITINLVLAGQGVRIFIKEGLSFITTSAWSGVKESYGILFALGGTLVTGGIAIAIAALLAIGSAVTIIEILPSWARAFASTLTDLSAAIPTVIYGLWGLFVLSPVIGGLISTPPLSLLTPYLGSPGSLGTSLLSASILLSIMIVPFSTAIIRESLARIPKYIDEALYSLGLTKFEVVMIKLRYIRTSILTALMISYGRAVGETVAVAMVIGNVLNPDFWRIFSPGYTIASLIADQYQNAEAYTYMVPAIFGMALILFLIGLGINIYVSIISRRG
ncbi:phosphate ABC transporter, inner membrane subunit PstC [Desulfurococcaceae archaeon AG1]|nr:MAG: phosphate ABC transporter permease subunit PstC [Desulfurococcaceae archaeon]GAY25191.1 phosphate ABC transporter, inner membrane subunit PstC [Desulfurococcaceae archaeon AG1]